MKSMSKQQKTTVIVVAVAVIVVIAALVCWASFRPQALEGAKDITVYVMHTGAEEAAEFDIHTTARYLAEALEGNVEITGTESEYGLFVDTVDGEYANGDAGQYWVYNVNGSAAEYGVDSQPIADGDIYSFYISTYVG